MIYFQIILVVIMGVVLNDIPGNNMENVRRKKIIYTFICLILCWLMASLRSVDWVASLRMDAAVYAHFFEKSISDGWDSLYNAFIFRYFYHIGDADIGYYMLNKLIGYITNDYNCLSLIITPLFFIPFGMLLYKYTANVYQIILALIFYIALIQVHLFSGARQMFAIGLDMFAIMFAMEDKKVKALCFFILGITMHFSSLITILPILLIFFDIKPKVLKVAHIIMMLLFPLIYIFPSQIIVFLGNLVAMERYSNYGADIQGGADMFIFLIGMISVFCFFAFDSKYLESNKEIRQIYTMVPLLTFFAPLINSNGVMMRISLYFFIYLTILIPRGIDQIIPRRSLSLAYLIVMSALILLIVKGGVMNYHFMWQEL